MPSDTIKVKVVFFASAKAAAGVDEWQAELPEGAKTTALRQAIAARFKLLGEHALERLARHERLRVLSLEPLTVLKPRGLVALRLEVCEQPPRAQQPDRYAATFRVVGEELA